jgi:hypothetical protein
MSLGAALKEGPVDLCIEEEDVDLCFGNVVSVVYSSFDLVSMDSIGLTAASCLFQGTLSRPGL